MMTKPKPGINGKNTHKFKKKEEEGIGGGGGEKKVNVQLSCNTEETFYNTFIVEASIKKQHKTHKYTVN